MKTMKSISRRQFLRTAALGTASTVLMAACAPKAAPAPAAVEEAKPTEAPKANEPAKTGGKLEIFSWWTSGGEIEALNGLYNIFKTKYPTVEIINAAIAGGTSSGGDMKALLQTRMMGGDPPDSFQVHLGGELFDPYVVNGQMEDLNFLYTEEGYDKVFPKSLIEIASFQGKPYSVPVNIHRANVLWYNKKMLSDIGANPPVTWDDFFTVAEQLKAKNQPALAVAENAPGFWAHCTETILIATLGAAAYRGLFNGKTAWDDAKVKDALAISSKALTYANTDFLSVGWGDVNDLMVNGKVAMMIMGDWTPGVLWSKGFKDFGWVPAPGNKGVYDMLSDSFGLPKGAKNRDNTINWLKVCGSKEGQDAFNPAKGSIPARTDADLSKYTDYHKDAMADWKKDEIVPSIVHGAAAKLSFMTDYMNIINQMAAGQKSVDETVAQLVKAAATAKFVA
jgi:glucose/mannose transport system substrate-binding protein